MLPAIFSPWMHRPGVLLSPKAGLGPGLWHGLSTVPFDRSNGKGKDERVIEADNGFHGSSGFLQKGDQAIFNSSSGGCCGLSCLQKACSQEFFRGKRRICGIHGDWQVFPEGRQQLGAPPGYCRIHPGHLWLLSKVSLNRLPDPLGGRSPDHELGGANHQGFLGPRVYTPQNRSCS